LAIDLRPSASAGFGSPFPTAVVSPGFTAEMVRRPYTILHVVMIFLSLSFLVYAFHPLLALLTLCGL